MEENAQGELAQFIQSHPPSDPDGDVIESVLTKFVLISEWVDGEGNRYLVRRYANGTGDNVPIWDIKGMLYESLSGGFDT